MLLITGVRCFEIQLIFNTNDSNKNDKFRQLVNVLQYSLFTFVTFTHSASPVNCKWITGYQRQLPFNQIP